LSGHDEQFKKLLEETREMAEQVPERGPGGLSQAQNEVQAQAFGVNAIAGISTAVTGSLDAAAKRVAEWVQRYWAEIPDDNARHNADDAEHHKGPAEKSFVMDFVADSADVTAGLSVPGGDGDGGPGRGGEGEDDPDEDGPPPPDESKPHAVG
jgi:hypothetical protein